MQGIKFTVLGNAISKKAPAIGFNRKTGGRFMFSDKKAKEWERIVKGEAYKHAPGELWSEAIFLFVNFYLLRPKSLPKKVVHHLKRPDWTNLVKAVEDALKGIIFRDDSQVINAHIAKNYGDPPRVEIIIQHLSEPEKESGIK